MEECVAGDIIEYKWDIFREVDPIELTTVIMALPVMEFQDQGYKIRKVFA